MSFVTFPEPFCYTINAELAESYCFYCLKRLTYGKDSSVLLCANCRFARFCSEECKEKAKSWHREECILLQNAFPNVPHTLVLFYSRLIRYLKNNSIVIGQELTSGDNCPVEQRQWGHLMTHRNSLLKEKQKMDSCKLLYGLTMNFLNNSYTVTEDEFAYVFCKKFINSHGIYNNFGTPVGEAMDFRGSAYDHSCRPNVGIVFDGFRMTYRALEPNLDISDVGKAFVCYTELAQSKRKRKKELSERYYFECRCARCSDPEDDKLVSIKCGNKNCSEPIKIFENQTVATIVCPKCDCTITEDRVAMGLECIAAIERCISDDSVFTIGNQLYKQCSSVLHPLNVYLADLGTTYMQMCLANKRNLAQALDMGIASTDCLRLCYPKNHKSLAFHLLKLAYIHVSLGDLDKVENYVRESLSILNVWFGKDNAMNKNLESLLEKLISKDNWINAIDLLKYFKFT